MIPLESLTASLEALSDGKIILTALGMICLWAWSLIIHIAFNLREISTPPEGSDVDVLGDHARFSRSINACQLSARVRKRLIHVHAKKIVHGMAGRISTVLVLASLAPLLGLLGTVDGVISTFEALSVIGNNGSEALTSGISKALITTQGGLLVAIPSLLAGGILYRKLRKLGDKLRLAALHGASGNARTYKLRGVS